MKQRMQLPRKKKKQWFYHKIARPANTKNRPNFLVDIMIDKTIGKNEPSACLSDGCMPGFCSKDLNMQPFPTRLPTPSILSGQHPEMEATNKKIASEMNNLSIEERERVYEDVHGIRKSVDENDELIAYALNEMESAIQHIKTKSAYSLAERMSKDFVHDRKLRLMFLRPYAFDAKKAAHRFVNFFEKKLECFGPEKLTTRITLSDLDKEDLRCLASGRCQILPARDQAGRTCIFFFHQRIYQYKTIASQVRAFWYMLMAAMEDEETQCNGVVIISYIVGSNSFSDPTERNLLFQAPQLVKFTPLNLNGAHLCFDNSKLLTLLSAIMKGIDSHSQVRARFHEGSHTECQFALMTFGIPVNTIPVSEVGKVKVKTHAKWLERRKIMENQIKDGVDFNGIDLPKRFDVLLGRGKPIQDHPGNVQLRQIINNHREEYESAGRGGKTVVANEIVQTLKKSRSRFVRQDKNGWWFEVTDDVSTEKVCHLFRKKETSKDQVSLNTTTKVVGKAKRVRVLK